MSDWFEDEPFDEVQRRFEQLDPEPTAGPRTWSTAKTYERVIVVRADQ